MSDEMVTVRVSPEQKQKLESLARQHGCTNSDLIRTWIDSADVSIPPKLMEGIRAEAQRRGYPASDLISRLVVAGWGRLRKDGSPNVFVLE